MRKTKTSWLVILSVIASVLAVIACAVLLNWFADKPIVQIPRRYRELVLYCTTPIEIVMIISSLILSIKCVVSTAKTGGKGKTFGLIGIGTSMLLILVWLCLGLFVILFSGPYETPPTMNPNVHVVNEQSVTGSVVYQDPYSTPTPTCTPIPVPTLTPTPTMPLLPTSSAGSMEPMDMSVIPAMPYDDSLTATENLNIYYEQILAPELGIIDTEEQSYSVVPVWGQGFILYPQVDIHGVALTHISDINADESPEMIVFRYERRRDDSRLIDYNELHMSVVSINDNTVYISDDLALNDYNASQIYSNNLANNYTTVALMPVDNYTRNDIIINHYSGGNYYSNWCYAFGYRYSLAEDNTFCPVSSAVQDGEGSSDLTGTVTVYDQQGNVLSEEVRSSEPPDFFTTDFWYEEQGIILTTDANYPEVNFENAEVIFRSIYSFNQDYDNPLFSFSILGE